MGRTKKVLSKRRIYGGIILIFITVGTHEQGMDRLFMEIDKLIEDKNITDEVFAQIGYTNYRPKNFNFKEMIGYDKMDNLIKKSKIIITHGGPGSIFHPLKYGKVPIVVPRDPKFNEHVDNHQILFTKRLENKKKVIAVFNINEIKEKINNYGILSKECNTSISENNNFINQFSRRIEQIVNFSK